MARAGSVAGTEGGGVRLRFGGLGEEGDMSAVTVRVEWTVLVRVLHGGEGGIGLANIQALRCFDSGMRLEEEEEVLAIAPPRMASCELGEVLSMSASLGQSVEVCNVRNM